MSILSSQRPTILGRVQAHMPGPQVSGPLAGNDRVRSGAAAGAGSKASPLSYRPEVDGLRAVAVIPVMLFHAGVQLVSGGFLGVDVFFVISGYLITSLIVDERQKGSFSIVRFYERRARRILPALFLVLLACLPFALLWLPPRDMQNFAQSLTAVSTFVSNIWLWQTSGYFDTSAEFKPLLHTWSLAVEEQYYVLFPLLLVACWRLGRRWLMLGMVAAAVLSLAAAQWLSATRPSADFYLLPTRGWELLIGAVTALYLSGGHRPGLPSWLREAGAALGLALIAFAVFAFTKQTPSPGLYTLVPTVGTALVILCASSPSGVGWVLSSKPVVGIGLISYSAYLWHQPMLAFARERSFSDPSKALMVTLCGAALVLAYLSWKFVETPFRQRQRFSRGQIFTFAALGSAFFIFCGLQGQLADGMSWRFGPKVLAAYDYMYDKNPRQSECLTGGTHYTLPQNGCVLGQSGAPTGVLIGDSHADALAGALDENLKRAGLSVRDLAFTGCPPALGVYRYGSPETAKCAEYNTLVGNYIGAHPEISTVVIDARWVLYLGHPDFDNGEGGVDANSSTVQADVISAGQMQRSPDSEKKRLILEKYVATVEQYLAMGKQVVLVYPVPEAGWIVPRTMGWKLRFANSDAPITTSYEIYQRRNADVIAAFDGIHDRHLVRVFPDRVLCNSFVPNRCVNALDGKSFYFDDNHLSNTGARLVVGDIVKALRR